MATLQERTQIVSIIIINYKTPELILKLITSLENNPQIEIIVIDNSPTDEISDHISNKINYHFSGNNIGFAAGVNKGIQLAHSEWVLLLNSDTNTDAEDILKLIKITTENNAQVATPKLISDDHVENNVGYFDDFFNNPINAIFLRPRFINCSKINDNTLVDVTTGGALLLHKDIIAKVGLFDEKRFFMYFEDIDYSLRLKKHGVSILYVPAVQITHARGGSSNSNMKEKNKNYKTSLGNYLKKNRGELIYYLNSMFGLFE